MKQITRRTFISTSVMATMGLTLRPAYAAPLKVAGMHTVPVENAWNSRLHLALHQAHNAGEIEYLMSENVLNPDYPRAMRQYAEEGVALIVGESYGVEREARQVAADYPGTAFLMGSSGRPSGNNFSVFGTWNHEAGYLTGLIAGRMSKSNIFGAVGGYPIPEVNRLINAFRVGVDEVNPNARHLIGFIGTWFDPPKAKETGLAQIDAGADILFGERIGTADAAKERGIYAIGCLLDYGPRYPGTVIASDVWNFDPILAAVVNDVKAGKILARDYSEYSWMKHGGNDLVVDRSIVPEDVISVAMARREDIRTGRFTVPVMDEEPKK